MLTATTPPATQPIADPEPRRFTVAEYYQMAAADVFRPDERVELIDGVVYQMAPPGPLHSGNCDWLNELFTDLNLPPRRWIVRVQSPVRLSDDTQPEPDLTLLRRRADRYRDRHPQAADVCLLVEISHSSLAFDRTTKAAVYARAGIVEYWILNLPEGCVEVHRRPDPAAGRYAEVSRAVAGQTLCLVAFPEVSVPAARLLGPT